MSRGLISVSRLQRDREMNPPSPLSALLCRGCTAAGGPHIGRDIVRGPVRPPADVIVGLLHGGAIIAPTTPAPEPDDDEEDGDLSRGIPAAAALILVSIGGLEMTDLLIISVSSVSYRTISQPH